MPTKSGSANVWSEEERSAMKAGARERKAASGRSPADERAAGLTDLQGAIAKMPPDDRAMAERIHEVVSAAVPALVPKTYYGMPAWATEGKNGKTICFFKPKSKFKVRYSTFEFQTDANLDDGPFWPVSFAVNELTTDVEGRITALVKQAVP